MSANAEWVIILLLGSIVLPAVLCPVCLTAGTILLLRRYPLYRRGRAPGKKLYLPAILLLTGLILAVAGGISLISNI